MQACDYVEQCPADAHVQKIKIMKKKKNSRWSDAINMAGVPSFFFSFFVACIMGTALVFYFTGASGAKVCVHL